MALRALAMVSATIAAGALASSTAAAGVNCPAIVPIAPLPGDLPNDILIALNNASLQARSLLSAATPGYALIITHGDRVLLLDATGVANATSGIKWTGDTPSRIASVTKVFPSVLLHQLADRGFLSLDAPVNQTCPDFGALNPFDGGPSIAEISAGGAGITWRQLASQLSGLQREAPAGVANTTDALARIASTLLVAPPGGRPSYSNLGLSVLGHLLAECVIPSAGKKAGLPADLPSLTAQLVAQPLGLQYASYVNGDPGLPLDAVMAAGTNPTTGLPYPQADYDLGWTFPAGSGVASANDLSLLGRSLLAAAQGIPGSVGSRLGLSPSTARTLLSPLYREPDGSYLQGAPWEMRPRGLNASAYPPPAGSGLTGAGPYLVLNKGGNLAGYTALLALVPTLNVTIAFVANGDVDEFALSDGIADVVLPPIAAALIAQDPMPRGNPGPREATLYVDTYPGPDGASVTVEALPQGGSAAGDALLYVLQVGGAYSFFLDYAGSVGDAPTAQRMASAHGHAFAVNVTALDVFRAYVPFPSDLPPGALTCELDVTLGLRGQYVFFYFTGSSLAASSSASDDPVGASEGLAVLATAMPGFAPGFAFQPAAG